MSLADKKWLMWKDDGFSVPFERFHDFAIREGFTHIFSYPFGDEPKAAFAARNLDDLNKILDDLNLSKGIWFNKL